LLRHGRRYKGELLFVLANHSSPLVGLYASTIAAISMPPSEMGAVQAVLLLASYLGMIHLGAFQGLNRNLAYHFARGETETGLRMVSASHFMARVNAFVGAAFGMAVMIVIVVRSGDLITFCAAITLTGVLYCTPYATHISTTCRSGQHFGALGGAILTGNGARLVHAWLPRMAGWLGYTVSMLLDPLLRLLLLKRVEPYPPRARFAWADLAELIRVGMPIMIVGYLSTLFLVADQSLIALNLSPRDLGNYTPARLLTAGLMTIPGTLSVLFSPKVAARLGSTGDPRALRSYLWVLLGVHLLLLVPICVAVFSLAGPVIRWAMPDYGAGIPAAQVAALACIAMTGNGALIVTTTLRDNRPSMWIQASSLALIWAAGTWMAWRGAMTIDRVAWLRLGVACASCVGLWIHAYWATRSRAQKRTPPRIGIGG